MDPWLHKDIIDPANGVGSMCGCEGEVKRKRIKLSVLE